MKWFFSVVSENLNESVFIPTLFELGKADGNESIRTGVAVWRRFRPGTEFANTGNGGRWRNPRSGRRRVVVSKSFRTETRELHRQMNSLSIIIAVDHTSST